MKYSYCSPETLLFNIKNNKSDVYSLGILILKYLKRANVIDYKLPKAYNDSFSNIYNTEDIQFFYDHIKAKLDTLNFSVKDI